MKKIKFDTTSIELAVFYWKKLDTGEDFALIPFEEMLPFHSQHEITINRVKTSKLKFRI